MVFNQSNASLLSGSWAQYVAFHQKTEINCPRHDCVSANLWISSGTGQIMVTLKTGSKNYDSPGSSGD